MQSVYVGTVIGNYDTTSILNNLYIQRQDNASHILQSLIGPLIFTTNLSETGSVFVRTIDMISPAKIVVPNIQTCLGFMHIVDKLLFTSVTYEELPDNITLPGEEASLAAPPSEVPDHIANSGPNSDENGNFSESEETDSGPTDFQGVLANFGNRPAGNEEDVGGGGNTNYAVVIAVSAAVAIAIGAVSCIVLVCMRDSKLFKNICKRRGVRGFLFWLSPESVRDVVIRLLYQSSFFLRIVTVIWRGRPGVWGLEGGGGRMFF